MKLDENELAGWAAKRGEKEEVKIQWKNMWLYVCSQYAALGC